VGAVPVHPITEADRLFGLGAGEGVDPVFAKLHEFRDARLAVARYEVLDIALALKAQFLFDLNLDPQALAVEAVLIALFVPGHGEVALEGVLVGPPPGVVDAHRVIGSDRTVEERAARLAAILGT